MARILAAGAGEGEAWQALVHSEPRGDSEWQPRRGARRPALAAAGLVVLGLGLACLSRSSSALRPARSPPGDLQTLRENENPEDTCDYYPYLKFETAIHRNLAGKGPDTGPEGMIWRTRDVGLAAGAEMNHEVDVEMHAVGDYAPFSAAMNGMQGEYGSINLKSGTGVSLKITFFDSKTRKQLRMKELALTFFDLDQGQNGQSRESVTINKFKKYHLSRHTEVQVSAKADGSRTFMSSSYGTGEDNPRNPMFLTQQQKNRAVTLMFENRQEIDLVLRASAGDGPRFFTFVGRPSLLCATVVGSNFREPLPDMVYTPPLQMPVNAEPHEFFERFLVGKGAEVTEGTNLFSTKRKDGSVHVYKAPCGGTLQAMQSHLKQGEQIDMRLEDKAMVVIQRPKLFPLPRGPLDKPTLADENTFLSRYFVKTGDVVMKGDPVAEVKDGSGTKTKIRAAKDGMVTAIQEELKLGDPVERAGDRNLATIGRLKSLGGNPDDTAVNAPVGCTFERFLAKTGDVVEREGPVAEVVAASGEKQTVNTPKGGVVTALQKDLKKGMNIDDSVIGRNLAVVGKFAPLEVHEGQTATNVPSGMAFEKWHAKAGDKLEEGDPIADVKQEDGNTQTIVASTAGIVKERQDGLQKGMRIDDAMSDRNIATVGKLPPLEVSAGEGPANAPAGRWKFVDWKVNVGDTVEEGQPVALVVNDKGINRDILASKYGVVKSRQEHLKHGYVLQQVMMDQDVAVIGKFPPMKPSGFRQRAVEVPINSIFDKYYIEEGQDVHEGDRICQVTLPGRRLLPGSAGSDADTKVDIHAPCWGRVAKIQPLKSGENVADMQEGPTVATLDQGTPWWVWWLSVLSILCCCLCCLFFVMKKPPPTYDKVEPPKTPEPEPDGLRLDFEDTSGSVRTVYAKYRPLGIKHTNEAPIIANAFTINSYAELELKVRETWKLRRIGNEELEDSNDFKRVNGKLTRHMKDFRIWPLPLEFKTDINSDATKKVEFTERPLGIVFSNRAPVRVTKVHPESPAAAAGIKVGWYVSKIGKVEVLNSASFKEVLAYFKEGVLPLDDSGRAYTDDA